MLQGILAVALSSVIGGIIPTLQKQLLSDGLPLFSMMLFNALSTEVATFLIARARGHSLKIERRQLLQALIMGPMGTFVVTALLNCAYLLIPVGTATMVHYFYPTVTCVIMGTVFKAGFSRLQVIAIAVSVAGMAFLAGQGGSLSPLGLLLAGASALVYSVYLIGNEKGSVNELPLEVKMFYTSLPSLAAMAVLAPATHNLALPATPASWLQLAICCLLGTLLSSFLLLFGIGRLGASTSSFLSMLCPIVSVVFSTIWFAEPVTPGIVIGSILILGSTALTTLDDVRRKSRRVPAANGRHPVAEN